MRLQKTNILIVFLYLLSLALSPVAKAETARVNDTAWQRLINDNAFGYRNEKENKQQVKENKPGALSAIIGAIIVFFSTIAGKIMLWLVIATVLGYVIYVVIRDHTGIFSKKQLPRSEPNTSEEVDIVHTNWEKLLQEAVSQNNTRDAIRYSYMYLLQLLQQHKLIDYRDGKTNYDYYHELKESSYGQTYRSLSRQYEYSWYGDYPISEAAYHTYMQEFNTIKRQLTA